jgi:hypothetical protein
MYSLCRHNRALMLLLSLFMALVGFPSGSSAQEKTLTVRSIAEAPAFAKRALVIGIGDYEHAASLAPTTYNDAKAVADLLQKQFGFPTESIVLMTDAPDTPDKLRPTFIHLKSAISTLLNGINEKSEVVIYFSGHGTRADNHDWLVPLDGLPAEVETTCINYDDFRSRLETKVPARALLIVDACRNLSGGKDAGSSGFGAGKGLTGPQFAELLSCRPKEISQVGKKEDFQESVFTHFLLEGLQGAPEAQSEGVVTFDSLKSFVQGSVSQYVSSKFGESQNPDGRASLGKMVLAKGLTSGVKLPGNKVQPGNISDKRRPTTKAEFTIDTSAAPDLRDFADKLRPEVEKWYPLIVSYLPSDGYFAPQKVTITFKNVGGVCMTNGASIVCSAGWFRAQPYDLGAVIHELVHVVQQCRSPENPTWLIEGVADYIRWTKFEPPSKRTRPDPNRAKYTDGYQTTAAFLEFVAVTYDRDIVVHLNAAMRERRYQPELWKTYTGKTINELWADYVRTL